MWHQAVGQLRQDAAYVTSHQQELGWSTVMKQLICSVIMRGLGRSRDNPLKHVQCSAIWVFNSIPSTNYHPIPQRSTIFLMSSVVGPWGVDKALLSLTHYCWLYWPFLALNKSFLFTISIVRQFSMTMGNWDNSGNLFLILIASAYRSQHPPPQRPRHSHA